MVIEKFFSLFSKDMAIDLGTANTLVYVKGEGVILLSLIHISEPTRPY